MDAKDTDKILHWCGHCGHEKWVSEEEDRKTNGAFVCEKCGKKYDIHYSVFEERN